MSSSFGMTRRDTMSLFGRAAGSVVATTLVAPAEAKTNESVEAATSTRLHYIFGYGSLIERESRMRTWSRAEYALPAVARGIARGWFDQIASPSWSPTYLGAVPDPAAECYGVLFPVTPVEFDRYVQRETGYELTKLDISHVTMLDGSPTPPDGDIEPGEALPVRRASHRAVLRGCLPQRMSRGRGDVPAGEAGELCSAIYGNDEQLGDALDQ